MSRKIYILDDDIEWLKKIKTESEKAINKIPSADFKIECYFPDNLKKFIDRLQELKENGEDLKIITSHIKNFLDQFIKKVQNEENFVILCDLYWCNWDEDELNWDYQFTPTGIYIRNYLLKSLRHKKIPIILISKETDIEKLKNVLPYGDFIFIPKRFLDKIEEIDNFKNLMWTLRLTSEIYKTQFFSYLTEDDFLSITRNQKDFALLLKKLHEGLRSYSSRPRFNTLENLKVLSSKIIEQGIKFSKDTILFYIDEIILFWSDVAVFGNCFIIKGKNTEFNMEHYDSKITYIAPLLCGWNTSNADKVDSSILFLEFEPSSQKWEIKRKIFNGKVEIETDSYTSLCNNISDSAYSVLRKDKQGKSLREYINSKLSPSFSIVEKEGTFIYNYKGNIIVLIGEFLKDF